MSESDEKQELSKRPWDPAGTQPKHDPASLLPESSEPLLPPDAEVVESDAIDEDHDGDLLPERHRAAGAPAMAAAGPSAYAPRFQFMTGALVAVGIAALVGITIAIVGIPPKSTGPPWSAWKPTDGGVAGATQIAEHVTSAYKENGDQLVNAEANDLSYKGVPLLVALKTSAEQGGSIQYHSEKGILYHLCGVGKNCAIAEGKGSKKRGFLLRRESLELALYTFRYLGDVEQVVVLVPPEKGKAQTMALYFQRDQVAPELARPLTASLAPTPPTVATAQLSRDATLVKRTTKAPYLFTLSAASFNNGGFLNLQPYSAAAEKQLQADMKEQQKQAAAAAAEAAAGTTAPSTSGG